jgi:hypothetical protein
MTKQVTPALNLPSFSCPHCGAHANQAWVKLNTGGPELGAGARIDANREPMVAGSVQGQFKLDFLSNLNLTRCFSCRRYAVWLFDKIVWPVTSSIVIPHEDMPDDVRREFIEPQPLLTFRLEALLRYSDWLSSD